LSGADSYYITNALNNGKTLGASATPTLKRMTDLDNYLNYLPTKEK